MATLYRENGTAEEVQPANGSSFTLQEMQTLVGGYIEITETRDGRLMVLDEEGKLKGKRMNLPATMLYRYGSYDPIVGDVVIGTRGELGGGEFEELTELQYAVPVQGESFRLYIFGADGMHSGGQWFRRVPVYIDEEISVSAAEALAEAAIARGVEVRVTDGGDNLVYHVKDGKRLYPAGAENVWQTL
jgi:hypothetical protein